MAGLLTVGPDLLQGADAPGALGPPTYDPSVDDAYDALVIRDMPSVGSYWKMNEGSGGVIFDRGPNKYDLALVGGAKVNQFTGPIPSSPQNYATLFSRVAASYAQFATKYGSVYTFPGLTPFTVEVWYYPLSLPSSAGSGIGAELVWKRSTLGGTTTNGGWHFCLGDNSGLRVQRLNISGSADTTPGTDSRIILKRSVWQCCVMTFDGLNIRVYLNAILGETMASALLIPENLNEYPVIGAAQGGSGQRADGYMARLAIYGGVALTQQQISDHFALGAAVDWTSPLPSHGLSMHRPSFEMQPPGFDSGVSTVTKDFVAAIVGASAVTADLVVSRALASAAAGIGSVLPNLRVSRTMATTPAGTSTVAPNLSVTRRLATLIAGAGTIAADLTTSVGGVTRSLATTIAGTSTVQGALQVTRRLATVVTGNSTVTVAQLTRQARMSVVVAGQSGVQGALKLLSAFRVTVSGSSSVLPNLTIVGAIITSTVTLAMLRRRRLARREGGITMTTRRRRW